IFHKFTPLKINIEDRKLFKTSQEFIQKFTEQEALVAAAFEDDDVIGDFEAEKSAIEEQEKPKDLDLTLQGWGSWIGPGIASKKKDRRAFVVKAEKKKRKDQGRNGLIISEAVDSSIDKVQPHSVKDYEAVVRQPIGKEWNPQRIHQKLIKPAVLTRVCISRKHQMRELEP
uniref:RRP15-like protein n=1 Tax=Parascaris equorum TaxID=6256 RepID=A0A914RID3_PAREQ